MVRDPGPSGRASALGRGRGAHSCSGVRLSSLQSPFRGAQVWLLLSLPAQEVSFLPPPAPRKAGKGGAGWEPQVRKESGVGEFGNWAVTVLFCLPHKPARASAAPAGAFRFENCSQNDRLVAPGWGRGWGWGAGGSPRRGGAGGLKIAAAGFRLANVEAGSWRRGRRQAMFARSAGLCFPWVSGVSHGGDAEEVLAEHPHPQPHRGEGLSAGFISMVLEDVHLPSRPSEPS